VCQQIFFLFSKFKNSDFLKAKFFDFFHSFASFFFSFHSVAFEEAVPDELELFIW